MKVTPDSSEHETIAGVFAPYGVALRGNAAYKSINVATRNSTGEASARSATTDAKEPTGIR